MRSHERASCLRRLRGAPIRDVVNALHPRLYCLNDLSHDDPDVLPPLMPVSSEVFQGENMYLLDDQSALWLYIGRGSVHYTAMYSVHLNRTHNITISRAINSVSSEMLGAWFGLSPGERPSSVVFQASSDEACRMAQVGSFT